MTRTSDDAAIAWMDCTEFVLLVDDLVEAKPHNWGTIVIKHLEECPPCRVYLQQMQDLRLLLDHVSHSAKLDDDSVGRVLSTIMTLRKDHQR